MNTRIQIDDEFEIIQNNILGAHLLFEFCKSYYKSENNRYPKLYILFLVLPILYNKETVELIFQRKFKHGSFMKSLDEKGNLFFDIQYRMEELAPKTLKSLNIAFASGILQYSPLNNSIIFNPESKLSYQLKLLNKDYQNKILAAKRLGFWFSSLKNEELIMYLNVKF